MGAKRRSLVELRLTVVIKSGIKRGLLGASDPLCKYSQLLHRLWLGVERAACASAVLTGRFYSYIVLAFSCERRAGECGVERGNRAGSASGFFGSHTLRSEA